MRVHVHVCIQGVVHVHLCAYEGQSSISGVVPQELSTLFYETGSLSLKLAK